MVVMSCVTITISLPQLKILSPVERNKNPRELMMQSTPGIMNTDLQLSGLERSEFLVLAASSRLPIDNSLLRDGEGFEHEKIEERRWVLIGNLYDFNEGQQ